MIPGFSLSPLLNLRSSRCSSLPRVVSERGEGRELQSAAGNLIAALMHQREEEGGSGEREKCSVALLLLPCDGADERLGFSNV